MSSARNPDWSRTGTIVAYAEWLRSKSDALCVVVVRRDDATLAADSLVTPDDAKDIVIERVIDLARDLDDARKQKRKGARLELPPISE
jgi:hypothetical protein